MTGYSWIPCYHTDPGHVDPACSDGGAAIYEWTYTTRLVYGVDPARGDDTTLVYRNVPIESPQGRSVFLLCKTHAALWRREHEDLDVACNYEIRSIPGAMPYQET